jgi:hypothetical protein
MLWLLSAIVLLAPMLLFWVFHSQDEWLGNVAQLDCEASGDVDNTGWTRGLTVGMAAGAGVDFEVRRENLFDEIAKWLRVSNEVSVGHTRFDERLYVVSDDPYVHDGLRFDPELPAALLAVFDAPYDSRVHRVRRVICRGGKVRVVLKTGMRESESANVIAQVAAVLRPLARRLHAAGAAPRRDPVRRAAIAAESISVGLLVHGLLFGVLAGVVSDPDQWHRGGPLGLVLAATLVGASYVRLRGTSRLHTTLLMVGLVGVPGALASGLVWAWLLGM